MKLVIVLIGLVAMIMGIGGTSNVQAAGNASIDHVRIFYSYQETNDWLIVIRYTNNDADNQYSNPEDLWTFQLLDGDDNIKAQQPVRMWGTRPGSIYIGAATANTLEWNNPDYKIRMHATYNASFDVTYNLTSASWSGNYMPTLDNWCVYSAKLMEDIDFATYVIATLEQGNVLNLEGGALFNRGIPGLYQERPNLFYVSETVIGSWDDGSEFTQSYEESLSDYEATLGTQISSILDDSGTIVGLSGKWIGGIVIFTIFIVIAGASVAVGHFGAGIMAGSLVLVIGMLTGLVSMALVFTLIAVGLTFWVKSVFWDRGAS